MTGQDVAVEVKEGQFEDIGKYAGDVIVALGAFFIVLGSVLLTPVIGIPSGVGLLALGKIISLLRLIRLDIRNMRHE